jgi:diaminopimelate epimerase
MSQGPDFREFDVIKAHANGNDFLFIEEAEVGAEDAAAIARAACHRHRGIGADGLIFYRRTATGGAMKLFNADGSVAEVSGNGVRCLAAILIELEPDVSLGHETVIETDGGIKILTLLKARSPCYSFRAFMGAPQGLEQVQLDVAGEPVTAVTLSVGNPQCVVLTSKLDEEQFRRLGPILATHSVFPKGANVDFVEVERPGTLRILIWERGVGPTTASGTGACASAVAAAAYGGAARLVNVISPGGSQQVEWTADGIYLVGWAGITLRGRWCDLEGRRPDGGERGC